MHSMWLMRDLARDKVVSFVPLGDTYSSPFVVGTGQYFGHWPPPQITRHVRKKQEQNKWRMRGKRNLLKICFYANGFRWGTFSWFTKSRFLPPIPCQRAIGFVNEKFGRGSKSNKGRPTSHAREEAQTGETDRVPVPARDYFVRSICRFVFFFLSIGWSI